MSANQLALWYLVAAVSFILALRGLSGPQTARRGNVYGMIGMAIALLVTLALVYTQTKNVLPILVAMAVGGAIGAVVARSVQMTQMPQLIAAMHSLVGLAAVFIAIAPGKIAARYASMFNMNDPTVRDRVTMLHIGERMIGAHPLAGVGPNMVQRLYVDYKGSDSLVGPDGVTHINPHLHNDFLQIAAERGLPALALRTAACPGAGPHRSSPMRMPSWTRILQTSTSTMRASRSD